MSETIQILPVSFEAEGCVVHLLEVLKNIGIDGRPIYHVALKLRCGSLESKVFNLSVRSNEELKAKILAEITKVKIMRFLYGDDFARRVVG